MAIDSPVPNSGYDVARSNLETLDKYLNSNEAVVVNRTGKELTPLPALQDYIKNITDASAFTPVAGSFQTGGVITLRNDILLNTADSNYYCWGGALPKNVSAGSTPATAGGVGLDKWVVRTDIALRAQLAATNSTVLVGGVTAQKLAGRYNVTSGTTASRPTGLSPTDKGTMYFDTTLNTNGQPIWWNGAAWVNASGVVA